jgi:hypothetical protein
LTLGCVVNEVPLRLTVVPTLNAFVIDAEYKVANALVLNVESPELPLTVKLEAVTPAKADVPDTETEERIEAPAERTPRVVLPVVDSVPDIAALAKAAAPNVESVPADNAFVTEALYNVALLLVVNVVEFTPAKVDNPDTERPFVIVADERLAAPVVDRVVDDRPPFSEAEPVTVRLFVTLALFKVLDPEVLNVASPVLPLTIKLEAVTPASPELPDTDNADSVDDPAESTPSVEVPVAESVPDIAALANEAAPDVESVLREELPLALKVPVVVLPVTPRLPIVPLVADKAVVVRPDELMDAISVP